MLGIVHPVCFIYLDQGQRFEFCGLILGFQAIIVELIIVSRSRVSSTQQFVKTVTATAKTNCVDFRGKCALCSTCLRILTINFLWHSTPV